MTHLPRSSNRRVVRRAFVLAGLILAIAGVDGCDRGANRPPSTEFIVAAGDSTYWVRTSGSNVRMRGSPLVLARLDGRFRELYVVDDDRSFEDALFVGQTLFQRDIISGDSTEIFKDTLVATLAEAYARSHPDARRLGPDEDVAEEPSVSATADVSVLGVHGPFLSVEYHVDTSGASDDSWHMTQHMVIDLRTGRRVTLGDVLGVPEANAVLKRARTSYRETVDSLRRDSRAVAQRAARSLGQFRFDPNSFSLTAPNGSLMIAFSAPGQGSGGEGFTMPIRPIAVVEPAWWSEARNAVPTSTREREEHWSHGGYVLKAIYDTAAQPVRMVLVDSGGREFSVGGVTAPVHRIYWLDDPPLDKRQRAALTKAFDEAALYEDAARAEAPLAAPRGAAPLRLASRR